MEFTEDNFFLGLGGVPENKWLSVSPFTVSLQEYNIVKEYRSQFELPSSTEYFISPIEQRTGDEVTFVYPTFIQIPVCTRGTHFGIQVDTEIMDKGTSEWSSMMPVWAEWNTRGINIKVNDNTMPTQAHSFRMTASLPDYYVQELRIVMEFEIVLQNPCNTGNSVILRDPNQKQIGTLKIMSEWSKKVLDLDKLFTDKVTKDGTLGTCGNLTYEL